jgi:RNA polymerase sigma factor (sigma-70 family)
MVEQTLEGWQSAQVQNGGGPWPGAAEPASEPDFTDWERFYGYCDGVIVTALKRQPLQLADREDCRQEIWASLLATQVSGFHGGSLAAWLKTLARNKAIDTMRRARRQPVGCAIEAMERAVVAPTGSCPADELVSVVRKALADLERRVEPRSYAVFCLRSFEHQSFGQIAGALSLTPEQARARHHRAKTKFRQIVEKHDFHDQVRL